MQIKQSKSNYKATINFGTKNVVKERKYNHGLSLDSATESIYMPLIA